MKTNNKLKKIVGICIAAVVLIGLIIGIIIGYLQIQNQSKSNDSSLEYKYCDDMKNIVVTVNQWESVTRTLAGACFDVKAIVNGVDVDPHDFEPLPADVQAMQQADILVVNGLGYDDWALKAAAGSKSSQKLINIGEQAEVRTTVDGTSTTQPLAIGDNPHIWYSLDAIASYGNILENALLDDSSDVDNQRFEQFNETIKTMRDELKNYAENNHNIGYVMSESLPYYLASDLGLIDKTPEGYLNAVNNEAEPTLVNTSELLKVISTRSAEIVFINTQEESDVTKEMEEAADVAGVKVVKITEQVPDNQDLLTWLDGVIKEITAA